MDLMVFFQGWCDMQQITILKLTCMGPSETTTRENIYKKWSKLLSFFFAYCGCVSCASELDCMKILPWLSLSKFIVWFEIVKNNIEEHPQKFGFLFERPEQREFSTLSHQTKIGPNAAPRKCTTRYKAVVKFVQQIKVFEKCMKPPLYHVYQTNFDHAVLKFGHNKVFEVLDKSMNPTNAFCTESNLYLFMIAAAYKESTVCVVNHLLRRDLSWVNECMKSLEAEVLNNKKRKHNSL